MPRAPGCGSSGGLQDKHYAHNRYAVLVIFQAMDAAGKDGAKDDGVWQGRYRSIRHFERHLHRNGTRIVKLFLHLSKEEQRKRFLARIDEPDKNWKLTPADIAERKYWQRYMKAYEACLAATSTGDAPWYGVPADDKGERAPHRLGDSPGALP